jgi:alpha-tubulin suppressor-like RCC1 family protein
VLGDGRVHCWWSGLTFWIRGVNDAVAISGRDAEGCVLRRSGIVTCWTLSDANRACFRFGRSLHEPPVVKILPGLDDAVDVSVFFHDVLVLRRDGEIVRFRSDFMESPPRHEASVPDAVKVVLAQSFACVNTRRGEVLCWGENWMGALGNGGLAASTEPSPVATLSAVAEIAGSDAHMCARRVDASVACWGSNQFGQIGVRSTGLGDARRLPVTLPELRATSLAGSTCVVTPARQLSCWNSEQTPHVMHVCR